MAFGLVFGLAVDELLESGGGHGAVDGLVAWAAEPAEMLGAAVLDVSRMGSWESAHLVCLSVYMLFISCS